ncbi:MAG: hypothetical protein EA421_02300 [Gemmatimonadales bacterium]|nr:MAG: hypothetical protein EA421_02300 [Gemmatimonadales bacterium]
MLWIGRARLDVMLLPLTLRPALILPSALILLAFIGGEGAPAGIAETPVPTTASVPAPAPEQVARAYLDAVEGMRWAEVVAHVHPEASASFREWLEVLLFPGSDPSAPRAAPLPGTPEAERPAPELLEPLTGARTVEAFLAMSDEEILLQAFRTLEVDSPGLINAWVDRSTEILGAVPEGDTLTHVVYRLEWSLQGATPDTEILTLLRSGARSGSGGAWQVLESRELGSLRPALGAVLRRLRSPPPGESPPSA